MSASFSSSSALRVSPDVFSNPNNTRLSCFFTSLSSAFHPLCLLVLVPAACDSAPRGGVLRPSKCEYPTGRRRMQQNVAACCFSTQSPVQLDFPRRGHALPFQRKQHRIHVFSARTSTFASSCLRSYPFVTVRATSVFLVNLSFRIVYNLIFRIMLTVEEL